MPSLLFAKLRLELEKKEKEGKRGLVSSAVVFDSLSLSLSAGRKWRRGRRGSGRVEARRRPRIPGQRVESFSICGSRADVARCFHWKMHFHGDEGNGSAVRFEHSFSISLSLSLSLALNSLLLYFKPRSFFFEHGFSSSTRASVRGNRSRERIFHGERSLRLALLSPRLRHSPSFCARLNVISNRGRNCSPIQRERERERTVECKSWSRFDSNSLIPFRF